MRHIESSQKKDGGFDNVFHTSLILLALRGVQNEPVAADIIRKGCEFILKERNARWTWNYWRRDCDEARAKPYPDDLDDTSCALQALAAYMPEKIDGAALAGFTEALISAEEKPGGPYETWLVSGIVPDADRRRWHDIDPVVNANIGTFLKTQHIVLPNLKALCLSRIETGTYRSKYYASPVVMLYFMARFLERSIPQNAAEKAVADIVALRQTDELCNTALETACALTTLAGYTYADSGTFRHADDSRLGIMAKRLEQICDEREWKADPIYIEEARSSILYSGAPALTAAFCVEALAMYVRLNSATQDIKARNDRAQDDRTYDDSVHEAIVNRVANRCGGQSMRQIESLGRYIRMLTLGDPGRQITLLPYHFEKSIGVPPAREKSDAGEAVTLGAANLFGWIAYRIYDDILDDEGEPEHVPLANMMLREVVHIYTDMIPAAERGVFTALMDKIESANAWERHQTRFAGKIIDVESLPDYKNLDVIAEKSIGHALGPITMLIRRGFSPDSREITSLLAFFKNYLVARQLNDDAHDWQKDLERGFFNPASVRCLSQWKAKTGERECDLSEDMSALRSVFWDKTIRDVAAAVLFHADKARSSLETNPALKEHSYLNSLLTPLESAARKALADRETMMQFLEAYAG
ncbi:MAG TPA: hypothetical protein VHE10_02955 [Candidatus Paceibacterota bacterium]|nr:hypothetical protein [Candidatus Paceibacterota bacterium]